MVISKIGWCCPVYEKFKRYPFIFNFNFADIKIYAQRYFIPEVKLK